MNQEVLHTEKILADRKIFFLDLKENSRGRVIKITEDVGGNRDTIMVPVFLCPKRTKTELSPTTTKASTRVLLRRLLILITKDPLRF